MYEEKLILTNPSRCPLALTNDFDDTFKLVDSVTECSSAEEFCRIANKFYRYGGTWKIDKDSATNTRLVHEDPLGNIHYLIAQKERKNLSDISTGDLIAEIVKRGFTVSAG